MWECTIYLSRDLFKLVVSPKLKITSSKVPRKKERESACACAFAFAFAFACAKEMWSRGVCVLVCVCVYARLLVVCLYHPPP